ncbi:MAG: hypothetical protein PWP27_217, partial [Clostridiales bacterium]|nr:hypothetical protein [Clostridiales bacterium]
MKPTRKFTADLGDFSTDLAGPDTIEQDFDQINKMFDPLSTHEDGSTGGIGTENIQDGAITTSKLADSNIDNTKLADDSISTSKIQDNAVTTVKILDGNVTTSKIKDANITTTKIADKNVTTEKINDLAVTNVKLGNSSVSTEKIQDSTVTTSKIANSNVTTEKIADSNITTAKINNGAVTTVKIADGSITESKLGTDSVITTKIKDANVTESKLAANSVSNSKIKSLSITNDKIADNAISTSKIQDEAITVEKIVPGLRTTVDTAILDDRITAIEAEVYSPDYTDTLTQNASIFSVGTGYKDDGTYLDVSDSVVKGQVSASVKGRTATNIVKNGNFADGTTGWQSGGAALTTSENTLSVTSDGTVTYPNVYQTTGLELQTDKKIFIKAKVKIPSECTGIRFVFYGTTVQSTTTANKTLAPNVWTVIYHIFTVTNQEGKAVIRIDHLYPDLTTANGKTMEVQEVMALDLTALGLDTKTADEINEMFPYWFDGTKSTLPVRIKSVGKNLFDKNKVKLTNIDANNLRIKTTTLQPNTQYYFNWDKTKVSGTHAVKIIYGNIITNIVFNSSTPTSFTTNELNEYQINFYFTDGISAQNIQNILDSIQIEEGTTATEYEPYKESVSYITLPDGVDGFHSLPNGTKDEIY